MATWKSLPAVQTMTMENEHRVLEEFLKELNRLARSGESFFGCKEVLERVIDTARWHFADEEFLMKQSSYPELKAHASAHVLILSRMEALMYDFQAGRAVFSSDISEILRVWMKDHILEHDRKFSKYLSKHSSRRN